jgi:hypothetical protein
LVGFIFGDRQAQRTFQLLACAAWCLVQCHPFIGLSFVAGNENYHPLLMFRGAEGYPLLAEQTKELREELADLQKNGIMVMLHLPGGFPCLISGMAAGI